MHTETLFFLHSRHLKNYKNFVKSWARIFELNQVLLMLVGIYQKCDFFAQKCCFICDRKYFMLVSL